MILAVLMAGLELAVFTIFIFGPLAVAAVVTAIVAAAGGSIEVQLAVFILLGLTSMVALYPIAKRHRAGESLSATNVDALIGKPARTLEALSPEAMGLIRLENDNWTARPAPGILEIPAGIEVEVVSIAGATAIVKPLTPAETSDA
jgi:membrane protein implicated in regulation of membrane protease activity